MKKIKIAENTYTCRKIVRVSYKDEYDRIIKKIFFKDVNFDEDYTAEFYSSLVDDETTVEYLNKVIQVQTANISLVRERGIDIEVIEEIINV